MPTCSKEFLSDKSLSHHRTMKQQCRIQWQKDKQTQKTCPYTSCRKKIPHQTTAQNAHRTTWPKTNNRGHTIHLGPGRANRQKKDDISRQTKYHPSNHQGANHIYWGWGKMALPNMRPGRSWARQTKPDHTRVQTQTTSFPKIIHKIPKTAIAQTDLMRTRIRTLNHEPKIPDQQAQQGNALNTENPTTPTSITERTPIQTTDPEQTIWQKVQYVTKIPRTRSPHGNA